MVELSLEPGVTAFVGPNGQGKTNLVEALGDVATHVERTVSPPTPRSYGTARRGRSSATVVVRDDRQGRWSSWRSIRDVPTAPG